MISMLNFADTKIVFVYAHAKDVEFNVLNALLQLRKVNTFKEAKAKKNDYTICTSPDSKYGFLDLR